jgi:hypothetical protein
MARELAYVFSNGRRFYEKTRYGQYAIGISYWTINVNNVVAPAGVTGQPFLHWLRYEYQRIVDEH